MAARVFELHDDEVSDGVKHVAFGSDPYISLGLGDQFSTEDTDLADRLAADELLDEDEG